MSTSNNNNNNNNSNTNNNNNNSPTWFTLFQGFSEMLWLPLVMSCKRPYRS